MKLPINLALLSVLAFSGNVKAAQDDAAANAVVTPAISIEFVSNLEFGSAFQGDDEKVVAAGSSENSENASFNILGTASEAYTVTLPNSVTMVTGDGVGADKQIVVNNFTSSADGGGTIGGDGTDTLFVGATRAQLSATQEVGTYTVDFTVEVVYSN